MSVAFVGVVSGMDAAPVLVVVPVAVLVTICSWLAAVDRL